MDERQFEQWVEKILVTEEHEIDCSRCFDLLSGYVQAEIDGRADHPTLKPVKQHLHQCQVCREEFELLRDLIREDEANLG